MNDAGIHEMVSHRGHPESPSQRTTIDGVGVPRLEEYESGVAIARQRFDQHPAARALFYDPIEAIAMQQFLIGFAVVGIRMTEPVEGWIRRAASRCGELGLKDLAKALSAHAGQEADHHLLMLADARILVEQWNRARKPELNLDVLLKQPATCGVDAYVSLHEGLIAGSTPYGQLAVEYEIERLSVTYGPRLIERCVGALGENIREGLGFLTDHVALDAGHTNFNRLQLGRLLDEHPDFLPGLISAGSEALDAYVTFLGDCLTFLRSSPLL